MEIKDKRVLVVVPSYNEGERIGDIIHRIRNVLSGIKVLVIDDCSTDDTRAKAMEAGATVLTHPVNLGYGGGLETGYSYALQRGFDVVIQMDGDGQHVAEEIPKILLPVLNGEADITIGSRYLDIGVAGYRTPLARRLGQRLFCSIYYLITRRVITDPTSGFQCLNKRTLELYTRVFFPDDFPDADVLLIAYYAKLRILEVAVRMLERTGGVSMHSGLRPIYYVFKMLFSMFITVWNRRKWISYGI
ncbi:MAG: glycosyltransferase family 2 protein [Nitrospirae bacterium]|nr:glycosyltransferase family 2 protein [Nitrospirota bacterium]